MRHSKTIFLYLFLVLGVSTLLNSILVYFESSHPGSSIADLSSAFWYEVVTITTVGYGDFYPISTGGKVIGYIYVFASLGVLGFLFSTISNKVYSIMEEKKLGFKGTKFSEHIVFLGWNDFNRQVADEVAFAGKRIAILTERKDDVDLIYDQYEKDKVFVLFSDLQNNETYSRLNVAEASVVFIALEDDSQSLMDVVNIKNDFPNIPIVVSLNEPRLKKTFESAGVTYVISRNEIASKLVASYIFEPDVAMINVELISSSGKETDFDVQEYEVLDSNPYLGKRGKDIFHALKDDHDVILIGISKKAGNEWKMIPNPSNDVTLDAGDYLVVMTDGIKQKKLIEVFQTNEGRIIQSVN